MVIFIFLTLFKISSAIFTDNTTRINQILKNTPFRASLSDSNQMHTEIKATLLILLENVIS